MTQVVQTPNQHYHLSKLLGYDYIICYQQGTTNTLADALSRRDTPSTPNFYLLTTYVDFLSTLPTENRILPNLHELHRSIEMQQEDHPNFKNINNFILQR